MYWYVNNKLTGTIWHRNIIFKILSKFTNKSRGAAFTLGFGYVMYESRNMNKRLSDLFHKRSRRVQRYIEYWYSVGCVVVIILHFILPFVLLQMMHKLLTSIVNSTRHPDTANYDKDDTDVVTSSLAPMIPGVNLSSNYWLVLWMCTMFVLGIHELGHAVAAASHNIDITSVGVFFAGLYPGAFVKLEDAVKYVSLKTQLKIYSAGIWHNLLCIVAFCVIFRYLPFLLLNSTHDTILSAVDLASNGGAVVVGINNVNTMNRDIFHALWTTTLSLLYYMTHAPALSTRYETSKHKEMYGSIFHNVLHPGDVITHINEYQVGSREDVYEYLSHYSSRLHKYHYNSFMRQLGHLEYHPRHTHDVPAHDNYIHPASLTYNLGSPFLISKELLNAVKTNVDNEQAMHSCCSKYFHSKTKPYDMDNVNEDVECFISEVPPDRTDASKGIESFMGGIEQGKNEHAGGEATNNHDFVPKSNLRGTHHSRYHRTVEHPYRPHADTNPSYSYYCAAIGDVYTHSSIEYLDLNRDTSVNNEDLVLRAVTSSPLYVFMIDIERLQYDSDKSASSVVHTIVVETTPNHILRSLNLENYFPKSALRIPTVSRTISEAQEGTDMWSNLYFQWYLHFLLQWPEVLHSTIWLLLQVSLGIVDDCCVAILYSKRYVVGGRRD